MKYMFAVVDTESGSATADEMLAIDSFNEELEREGRLLFAAGLAAPDDTHLVDGREGAKTPVVQRPLIIHDEYTMGFWIVKVDSEEDALALALRASEACNRRLEVRALQG